MKEKVLAYVLRTAAGQAELLVFAHRDVPIAGIQVPAGSVAPGESPETAAWRELAEESGLGPGQVRLARKLAEAHETDNDWLRHVYLLEPRAALPERWRHTVTGEGEDAGMVFEFYWLPATPALRLAGAQERYLRLAGAWGEMER
jgi:ADP-ribose pyrophosphatase YjhB (NUDIX family)